MQVDRQGTCLTGVFFAFVAFGMIGCSLTSLLLSLTERTGVGDDGKSLTGVGIRVSIYVEGCGVAPLGVRNGVAGGGGTMTGGGVAICSVGGCNGVDSGGGATWRT